MLIFIVIFSQNCAKNDLISEKSGLTLMRKLLVTHINPRYHVLSTNSI